MPFQFATAGRIIFGYGTSGQAPELVAGAGSRAMVLTAPGGHGASGLLKGLAEQGVEFNTRAVEPEPTVEAAWETVLAAREMDAQAVVGVGGGSVLDMGKVAAAMLTNQGELFDYLEVIGQGRPLANPSAFYLAMPTTSGTGAEVTSNSVLFSPAHGVKVSMRSPHMLPKVAVVDPGLTVSMPPALTAATGLDALTQLLEPLVSPLANPLTDAVCVEGLKRAGRSLLMACREGGDRAAWRDMALASLMGGLALANAKLGAVHGLAGPLGGVIAAPHGAICARLLPLVVRANLVALKARVGDAVALERYDLAARLITGKADAHARELTVWLDELVADTNIPGLASYGLEEKDLEPTADKAHRSSSMKGNPVELTSSELVEIMRSAL